MARPRGAVFKTLIIALVLCCPLGTAIAHPGSVDQDGCHTERRTGNQHCHPDRAKLTKKKPVYDADHPPKAGDEGVFYGPFVSVTDGDTFSAKVQGVIMRFRLEGIDAPEQDQPYGSTSTALLSRLIRGQNLVLVFSDVDTYGRIVVRAWVGNFDINAEMLRRGAAWFESVYSQDDELYWIEDDARKRKVGLWALPLADRVPPWTWRKEKR